MLVGSDEWWEFRAAWALPVALLGGLGYRPRLTPSGLSGYCGDGSTFTVACEDGTLDADRHEKHLTVSTRTSDGVKAAAGAVAFEGDAAFVEAVAALVPPATGPTGEHESFIRHFPPQDERQRMILCAAYGTYRAHLDALAAQGIHAYIEQGFDLRLYSDVSPDLFIDVSLDDDGLPALGERDGDWVVFITGRQGHEAEFEVARSEDIDGDAEVLADAVALGLSQVLRGNHVFMERYDPVIGRLDPPWLA